MIPAVSQTLAEILANGIPVIGLEQIDFNPPTMQRSVGPRMSLYWYDIQENIQMYASKWQEKGKDSQNQWHTDTSHALPMWFDASFLVSAYDCTALGEQYLLSEALLLLLHHRALQEELLAPALRGHGNLSMIVSSCQSIDKTNLWSSLRVPLRPALYVAVTIPFNLKRGTPVFQEISTASIT